ncbi:MAG: hypothetical protein ACOCZJ_01075 [Thermoplasmatota archaeon]
MDKKEFREKIKLERRKENIRVALRARDFTEQETLEMGLEMIEFALKLNRMKKDES